MSDEHLLNVQFKMVPFFDLLVNSYCDISSAAEIQREMEMSFEPADFQKLIEYKLEDWSNYHESFQLVVNTMFLFGLCFLMMLIFGAFIYVGRELMCQRLLKCVSKHSMIYLNQANGKKNGSGFNNYEQYPQFNLTSSFHSIISSEVTGMRYQHFGAQNSESSFIKKGPTSSPIDEFVLTSFKKENLSTTSSSNLFTAQEEIFRSALEGTITTRTSTSQEKEMLFKTQKLANSEFYVDHIPTSFPYSSDFRHASNVDNHISPIHETFLKVKELSYGIRERTSKTIYRCDELVDLFPRIQLQYFNGSLGLTSVLKCLYPCSIPKYGDLVQIDRMLTEIRLLLMNGTYTRQPISDNATRRIAVLRFLSLALNIRQGQNPFIFLPSFHRLVQQLVDTGAILDVFNICQPLLTYGIIEIITEYCDAMWNHGYKLTYEIQKSFHALGLVPTLQQPFQCFKFLINMELTGIKHNKIRMTLNKYAANKSTKFDKLILKEAIKLSRDKKQVIFFSRLLTDIKDQSVDDSNFCDKCEESQINFSFEGAEKKLREREESFFGDKIPDRNLLPGHI